MHTMKIQNMLKQDFSNNSCGRNGRLGGGGERGDVYIPTQISRIKMVTKIQIGLGGGS